MGGVLICISILVPTLLWADLSNPYVWVVMLSTLAFGAIGFADDYIKVVRKRSKGLTFWQKIGLQFAASAAVAATLVRLDVRGSYSTRLMVPFAKNFRPDLVWQWMGRDPARALAGVPALCRSSWCWSSRSPATRSTSPTAWTGWPSDAPSSPPARWPC